jgi:hypothetical protein
MLKPDLSKWNQTLSDLPRLSREAEHVRSRERFQALDMRASGQSHASRWASEIGRQNQTVMPWVPVYNASGPERCTIRKRAEGPPFCPEQVAEIVETVSQTVPMAHGLPGYGWSIKQIRRWVKQGLRCEASRTLLRTMRKDNGLRWKQCQKVLAKAKPEKRQASIQACHARFRQMCQGEIRLLYLDESHFHRELDLGYTWAPTGKPAWRLRACPRLADRINGYGAYDFTDGHCFICNEGACNGEHTVQCLPHRHAWLGDSDLPVVILWDGAPCHRAQIVQNAAADLGFTLVPLPGYRPDLTPMEGLWQWMREEVTQQHCDPTMRALFDACKDFIDRINLDPEHVIARLWPKFDLDPDFEKLLFSN